MRVLITGAAGFLGSHLVDRFLLAGHHVVGVDNFITGNWKNLEHLEGRRDFFFIEHDISTPLFLAEKVDGVLHFASPASPVDYLDFPIQTLKVGSLGTHVSLGVAKAHKARFLLASTSEVYGDPQIHPQPEHYWGHVNPIGPRGVYDEAKRFAEAMTMAYHRFHGLDTRIARIFNTYGPRMRPADGRVVSNFIVQALRSDPITLYGDGNQTRSFCFVDDEVEGLFRLFFSAYADPVNVGNPNEFTIRQLAEIVLEETRSRSEIVERPLPQDDPKVRRPDIGLAERLIDWSPSTDLREGLRKTIPYFRVLVDEEGAQARALDPTQPEGA